MPDIYHRHFDVIDSTNTAVINDIVAGSIPSDVPQLYTASHQAAGRGQHGRSWVSGSGNVFLSLYVPMGTGFGSLDKLSGLLSLVIGLHLAKLPVIAHINAKRTDQQLPPIGVKWANDVGYYDDAARVFYKLAGILIEPVYKVATHAPVGVVIGVGLNVGSAPIIADGLYKATCLSLLDTELTLHAADLYRPICDALLAAVHTCNGFDNQHNLSAFIETFNHHHVLQDKNIAIYMQNNTTDIHTQGTCLGIGTDGELLLQSDTGITPIYAGMAQII